MKNSEEKDLSEIENQEAGPMVYIVTQQPFDYAPAARFGTLYFMKPLKLAPDYPGGEGTYNTNLLKGTRKELQDYRPGIDYIVPTGQPACLLLVGMILSQIGGTHKLLQWDGRAQKYHQSTVTV